MKPRHASWETIQKEYPDRFVLLENPVFDPTPYLKEAVLLYTHKSRKKVIEKELEDIDDFEVNVLRFPPQITYFADGLIGMDFLLQFKNIRFDFEAKTIETSIL